MTVTLRPAEIADRERIYRWLARSEATPEMMGPPVFPDHPVPTYAEFCDDYVADAFSGSRDFQVLVIKSGEREIGSIQYFLVERVAELDIWIANRSDWGQGHGPQAIECVVKILQKAQSADIAILRPSARNSRAIKGYMNAGFRQYDPSWIKLPDWCLNENLDYEDAVVLARRL